MIFFLFHEMIFFPVPVAAQEAADPVNHDGIILFIIDLFFFIFFPVATFA